MVIHQLPPLDGKQNGFSLSYSIVVVGWRPKKEEYDKPLSTCFIAPQGWAI
jgi:hypothetical protein